LQPHFISLLKEILPISEFEIWLQEVYSY